MLTTVDYTYDLHMWNSAYQEMMDTATTLDFYRTSYEDEISRKELEANLVSLEAWAAYAHTNKLLYHVYVRLAGTGQPYAALILNDGNVIVSFLDEYHREYMIYTFMGKHEPGRLFLESLHYFEYPDAQWATPAESSADTQYEFTPGGQLTVRREYSKDDGHRYQSEQTAADPVDVAPNWEPAPVLGDYAGVLALKRWGEQGTIVPLPQPEFG